MLSAAKDKIFFFLNHAYSNYIEQRIHTFADIYILLFEGFNCPFVYFCIYFCSPLPLTHLYLRLQHCLHALCTSRLLPHESDVTKLFEDSGYLEG